MGEVVLVDLVSVKRPILAAQEEAALDARWKNIKTPIFQVKAGAFSLWEALRWNSDDYFLEVREWSVIHRMSTSLRTAFLPSEVALSWKLWGSQDGKDWACWRSESGHITGLKGVCVFVCVCVAPIDSQSMPRRPTRTGFLWLKKVKGEYNDIKTWWLHPGSDHSAPRLLPDRERLEGGKERGTEKTREGEEAREKQRVGTNVWNKGWMLQILEGVWHKGFKARQHRWKGPSKHVALNKSENQKRSFCFALSSVTCLQRAGMQICVCKDKKTRRDSSSERMPAAQTNQLIRCTFKRTASWLL